MIYPAFTIMKWFRTNIWVCVVVLGYSVMTSIRFKQPNTYYCIMKCLSINYFIIKKIIYILRFHLFFCLYKAMLPVVLSRAQGHTSVLPRRTQASPTVSTASHPAKHIHTFQFVAPTTCPIGTTVSCGNLPVRKASSSRSNISGNVDVSNK